MSKKAEKANPGSAALRQQSEAQVYQNMQAEMSPPSHLLRGCLRAFLVGGLICLLVERRPGLWCAWALFLMVDGFLRYGTGLSWVQVRFTFLWKPSWNYTRLAIAWCQLLCAMTLLVGTVLKLGRAGTMEWTKKNRTLFAAGCVLFLLLSLPLGTWLFQAGGLPVSGLVTFMGWFQDGLRLALLAALGTMLVRGRKR